MKLRELREQAGLSLRKAALQVDIDVAILSKMERGEKKFSKELVLKLADLYKANSDKLIIDFLCEKVLNELENEDFGLEALKVAEKQLKYKKNLNSVNIHEKAPLLFTKSIHAKIKNNCKAYSGLNKKCRFKTGLLIRKCKLFSVRHIGIHH